MSEKWAKRGGAFYREQLKERNRKLAKQAKVQEAFRKELERKPLSTRAARALVSGAKGSYSTSKATLRELQRERKGKSRKT